VGGPVRDAFLGRQLTDLDFATNATPDEILHVVGPISTTTWDIGRDFGTIGARVQGEQVEITTYRSDTYDRETRKPIVAFGNRIDDDLLRRDFTVNAMALSLPDLSLVDPSGGFDDLVAKRLRTPGTPEQSFADDPLRMMRAARFVAQLEFILAPEVVNAMTALADSILMISAERVRDEFVKLIGAPDPVPGIRTLVETGILEPGIPRNPRSYS